MAKLLAEMIRDLFAFFRSPVYQEDKESGVTNKFIVLGQLLAIALFCSIAIGLTIGALEEFTELNLGKHAMDLLFEEYSAEFILLVVVILAPVLEELFFRGPLYLFRQSRYFGLIFYVFTFAFGFYHITNFKITPTILYLSPLLVSPQLLIGLLLGYIRVRLGLQWAILLHALYNLVLIGPLVLLKVLNIELQ